MMPKVIQGSFLSGQPKLSPSIHTTPPAAMPTRPATPGQTKKVSSPLVRRQLHSLAERNLYRRPVRRAV